MKKKLLFFVAIIAALMCLFAISSSAATRVNLDGEELTITTYTDAPTTTNIKTSIEDVVIFDDGFCCPSAYIFDDKTTIDNGNHSTPGLSKILNFKYINGKTEKNYGIDNIVELDIPEGIVTIGEFVAYNRKSLRKITIPYSVTSLGGVGFQNASNLEECVFEKGGNPEYTTFNSYMFSNCISLKGFSMPDSVTQMVGQTQFSYCTNIGPVYLSKNLTKIECSGQQNASFDKCYKLYFVNEPFTTSDTAPEKPIVYYFPENLSSISNQCVFRYCENINDVLVFGKGTTSVPNEHTFQHSPKNTVVFLGDMVNVDATSWGTSTLIFANKNDKSASDIATLKGSKTKIFCNADGNTTHLTSDKMDLVSEATCVDFAVYATKCFCGKNLGEKKGTELDPNNHDLENATLVSIVYPKYTENGTKTVACGYDGCGEHLDSDVKALFVTKGYSIKNDGCGITTDYEANSDELKAYIAYVEGKGGSFTFGAFVGNSAMFGDTFINANGTINNSYAFINPITTTDYFKIKCTVADFTTDEATLTLVMGLYVIEDGKVSYIQHEGTYAGTVTADTTLDVVTITKIAELTGIELALPTPKAIPNKED